MDFIFASSIRNRRARRRVVSYDIACQWCRHYPTREATLPESIRADIHVCPMDVVIPKFHIGAHGSSCQTVYSLNFRRFMGRTDGENIERGWAWMNPASLSTREMGPGARHDTLDDQWAYWNYQRNVRLGMFVFLIIASNFSPLVQARRCTNGLTRRCNRRRSNAKSTINLLARSTPPWFGPGPQKSKRGMQTLSTRRSRIPLLSRSPTSLCRIFVVS